MNITIFGCGSWGGVIAQYLHSQGHQVSIWHRNGETFDHIVKTRMHPKFEALSFHESISIKSDLSVGESSDTLIFAVPSNAMRILSGNLKKMLKPHQIIVNVYKGLEEHSLLRMSSVIIEEMDLNSDRIVSLYGPSHAEEVLAGIPTALVSTSTSHKTAKTVQEIFSSDTLRVYTNTDIIGVELGGSLKNVIAIAAGICDGIGFGDNSKAALMVRGSKEISRLGEAMQASEITFHGLSGIGDLIVTCLSKHSRNRYVGEAIGRGEPLESILDEMGMIAEGVTTAKSIMSLQEKYGVDLPICSAVSEVLFIGKDPKTAVKDLMARSLTSAA